MRVTSARRLVAMAAAAALGSAGVVLSTTPAANAGPATLSNPTAITINDAANATPYPSAITVSGLEGTITAVTVTLTGLSHGALQDVGVVLVAPNGDALMLMSGVGSPTAVNVNNVDLTISDSGASLLPNGTNPVTGTYQPASHNAMNHVYPAPGPEGAYERPATDGAATLSSVFGGDAPNGTWNLFVRDFFANDVGSISGGWSLSITTTKLLQDGGFEAGTGNPINSPAWTEADSQVGSPICNNANCQTGGGASPPRTGSNWAWFGGEPVANHTSSISQTFVIPTGEARLTYWYRNGTVSSPFDAVLLVKVDGTTVKTHNEETTAQGAYSQQTVDLSAYADGNSHTLSLEFNGNTGAVTSSMVVDDVSIDRVTATPSVEGIEPATPNQYPFAMVTGTGQPGSTFTMFMNDTCTSASIGSGSYADFVTIGIPVTVPENTTTTIYARASKAGQLDSACSSNFVSYTHDSIPPGLPTGLTVSPSSPDPDPTPTISGTAEADTTVNLYTTSDCSGLPWQTGTAEAFGSTGLTNSVAIHSTATFKATATDAAGNTSACSTSSVSYVHDSTPPVSVTLSSVTPASPNPSTTAAIAGTAEAGSTVKLYTTAGCTGSPAATGTADAFFSPGLTATVAVGSTTTFKATATDAAGNISTCSTSSVTYVQQNPATPLPPVVPDTTLTKTPKKKVTTTKSKAKVSFEFSSATAGATFQCSIDTGAFAACTSGQTLKLKAGKHTFVVRAVAAGQTDPTPATYSFKIKRKH